MYDIPSTPMDAIRQNIRSLHEIRDELSQRREPMLKEANRLLEKINEIDEKLDAYHVWMKANGHV